MMYLDFPRESMRSSTRGIGYGVQTAVVDAHPDRTISLFHKDYGEGPFTAESFNYGFAFHLFQLCLDHFAIGVWQSIRGQ